MEQSVKPVDTVDAPLFDQKPSRIVPQAACAPGVFTRLRKEAINHHQKTARINVKTVPMLITADYLRSSRGTKCCFVSPT